MKIRKINKTDYKDLTKIHLESFKDFFLSSLGKKFLQVYYKASLNSNESIAFCAIDENLNIQGFCVGCCKSKGYHKRLLIQNLVPFLIQGIFLLLSKPKAIIRLAKNLDKISNKNDDGNYAEIHSIGVSSSFKGMGIGKELIKKFEEEAKLRECEKVSLTTDYLYNESAISFYQKAGYNVFYEFKSYPNRKMFKLIKEL